jgi:hypothetical protein
MCLTIESREVDGYVWVVGYLLLFWGPMFRGDSVDLVSVRSRFG